MTEFTFPVPPKPEPSPFSAAVATLRRSGKQVEPAPGPIPGLVLVDGRELTMGQVIDYARQLSGR